MTTIVKPKVTVALFGAAQIKGQPDAIRTMLLGTMGGVANGVFSAKAQDGVTDIWGLKGDFYAQVIRIGEGGERTIEAIQSGKCFLPDHIQSSIETLFLGVKDTNEDGTEKVDDKGKPVYKVAPIGSIEFGYKVHVERAGNKAGYSYAFEPLQEAKANDPLAQQKAAALAALGFGGDGKALPAPDKAKK